MSQATTEKVIVAAQIVIACALTWGALEIARYYGGRGGLWLVGLLLLLFVGFSFFRLRKKV